MSGFGDALRHARSTKGVTLTEAERALRIPRKYLRALEEEDFRTLPVGVYSRGIVRNYAQYLQLDPDDAIAYFEELRGQPSGTFKVVPAVKPLEVPTHWAPNFAAIAFVFVIGAVLFAWLYSAFFAASSGIPTPTPGLPTPTVIDVRQAVLALTPVPTKPPPPPTATPLPPTAAPAAPTPTPTKVPPAPQPAPAQPQAAPPQAPAPASAAAQKPTPKPKQQEVHVVTIQAQEAAWVQVTIDGAVEFAGTMVAGQTINFEGGSIAINSGNATNVFLWVDGAEYGVMSETSSIADVTIP